MDNDSIFQSPLSKRRHNRPCSVYRSASSDRARYRDRDHSPPPPLPPPRRRVLSDTDDQAPPIPAREPITAWAASASIDQRLPSCRLEVHRQCVRQPQPPALDSVVPLSRWPLRSGFPDKPLASPVAPVPILSSSSSTPVHSNLDSRNRRGLVSSPPANVIVVTSTSSSVNHMSSTVTSSQSSSSSSAVVSKPGNLYVDSPTSSRPSGTALPSNELRSSMDNRVVPHLRQSTSVLNSRQHTGLVTSPGFPTSSSTVAGSLSVKFNHVVETSGGDCSTLRASEKFTSGVVNGQPRSTGTSNGAVCRGGIMCQRCGRCRCANCTAPHELPRRWYGDCECSFQRCVNVVSCLCCVEALFYHFLDGSDSDDGGGVSGTSDDPCACCERPRCCLRWSIMAALAGTVLPCLCCYCPLQCASDVLTSCYNLCVTPRGCRCRGTGTSQETSSGSSTRGLLAESENSSA